MKEDKNFEDLLIKILGENVTLKFFNPLTNLNTKLIFCKNFEPYQLQLHLI